MKSFIGQRLSYDSHACTVRYIGTVANTAGEWLGVEWDDPQRGKHDGSLNGMRYFTCRSTSPSVASFIRPTRRSDADRSFLAALRKKYVEQDTVTDISHGQDVYFNGKLAEEVGFDKIRDQLAALGSLRIVLLNSFCIKGNSILREDPTDPTGTPSETTRQISSTCPNIRQLSINSNLFETFDDIAIICSALPHLSQLDMSQNRLREIRPVDSADSSTLHAAFGSVIDLNLDKTLLESSELAYVLTLFPKLKKLSLGDNQLSTFTHALPAGITQLELAYNSFKSLADISVVSKMPELETLSLYGCHLLALDKDTSSVFNSILRLDLSDTGLSASQFGYISQIFPNLKSLRCSGFGQNDRFFLIAQIPSLEMLNSGAISAQLRMNSELYYLNSVSRELVQNPEKKASLLDKHPRWEELCAIHGAPSIVLKPASTSSNTHSLENSLVTVSCMDARAAWQDSQRGEREFKHRFPGSISTHRLYSYIARSLDTYPQKIRLICHTSRDPDSDAHRSDMKADSGHRSQSYFPGQHNRDDENEDGWSISSDSEDENGNEIRSDAAKGGEQVQEKETVIPPGTRSLNHYIEGKRVFLRIEDRG